MNSKRINMNKVSAKDICELLTQRYSSQMLSRIQAADALGISVPTLDRLRADGLGPSYKLIGKKSRNQGVKYPVFAIAEYVFGGNVQTV